MMDFARLWPWRSGTSRSPVRAQTESSERDSATDLALSEQWEAATGNKVSVAETAAREIAAGILGRAFASATIEGDDLGVLSPSLLMMAGRRLVTHGEFTALLAGPPFRLIPAATVSVRGGNDRARWTYLLTLNGPSDSRSAWYLDSEVIHVAVNADPFSPWRGRSAFELAKLSADTMTYAERSARDESKVASARIGVVATTDAEQRRAFELTLQRGGASAITTAANPVGPTGIEPSSRYSPGVQHPDPTAGHVQLRRDTLYDLCASAGIPPSLVDSRSDGSARRESYRQLLHTVIQPMARVAVAELREKLGTDIRLTFKRLAAGDLAARTRAYKQLVESGVAPDSAMAIVQLVDGED